jgi:hypothetical protein
VSSFFFDVRGTYTGPTPRYICLSACLSVCRLFYVYQSVYLFLSFSLSIILSNVPPVLTNIALIPDTSPVYSLCVDNSQELIWAGSETVCLWPLFLSIYLSFIYTNDCIPLGSGFISGFKSKQLPARPLHQFQISFRTNKADCMQRSWDLFGGYEGSKAYA